MDQEKLLKMSSITKKICVALLGGFLLIFLLVHASANLCILRGDEGKWYTDFCHFFGSNYVIKVFEVVLLAAILLHICMTIMLQIQNWKARPVRYHQASKTKTATGSKLMIWTGILIICFFVMHFLQFWLVKVDVTEGKYMAKIENLEKNEKINELNSIYMQANQYAQFYQGNPEDLINEMIQQSPNAKELEALKDVMSTLNEAFRNENGLDAKNGTAYISADQHYVKCMNKEQKESFEAAGLETEPDFYYTARNLFTNPLYVIVYLICFVVLWFHMRHAFESAFQTLGWNNLKYYKAIDIVAIAYATIICLMFAAVAVGCLLLA